MFQISQLGSKKCFTNFLSPSYSFFFQITNTTNGSVVISTLTFLPVPSDDNTKLKCEGSNPRLPNSALEDTLIMNVLCKSLWALCFSLLLSFLMAFGLFLFDWDYLSPPQLEKSSLLYTSIQYFEKRSNLKLYPIILARNKKFIGALNCFDEYERP